MTLLVGQPGRTQEATQAELEAWQSALNQNSTEAYFRYLSQFPSGEYVEQAISALIRLGALDPQQAARQAPPMRQVPEAERVPQQQPAVPATPTRPAAPAFPPPYF